MTNAHLASAYDFLLNVAGGQYSSIDFSSGAAVQEIVEAAYHSGEHGAAGCDAAYMIDLIKWRLRYENRYCRRRVDCSQRIPALVGFLAQH